MSAPARSRRRPVTRERSADRVLTACGFLSVLAAAAVLMGLRQDVPDTTMNSVIDGVRFVLSVGVMIGGAITVIERRLTASAAAARAVASAASEPSSAAPEPERAVVIDLRGDGTADGYERLVAPS